jgi:hypothetical protein
MRGRRVRGCKGTSKVVLHSNDSEVCNGVLR